jgi:ribose-phosphate pyrophosphokinase
MICLIGNLNGGYRYFIEKVYEKLREKLEEKVELIGVKIIRFRDGEIKVKIEENVREKTCFYIHDCSLTPSDWFLQLALINHALKYSSANKIVDVLPYHYFARQDRKDESRVAINAKVVADTISLYADRVVTCDLHSPQIQAFYEIPLDNLYSFPSAIEQMLKDEEFKEGVENLAIMAPDEGGVKRALAFLKKLSKKINKDIDLVIGYKERPKEGEISNYRFIGNVKGKNVLVIDDIIDSGNTLANAAKVLKENAAEKVFAYATHGLFTEGHEKLKEIDKIFVSNTKPQDEERVKVIDLTDLFAEAIFRIYKGLSLSSLFE